MIRIIVRLTGAAVSFVFTFAALYLENQLLASYIILFSLGAITISQIGSLGIEYWSFDGRPIIHHRNLLALSLLVMLTLSSFLYLYLNSLFDFVHFDQFTVIISTCIFLYLGKILAEPIRVDLKFDYLYFLVGPPVFQITFLIIYYLQEGPVSITESQVYFLASSILNLFFIIILRKSLAAPQYAAKNVNKIYSSANSIIDAIAGASFSFAAGLINSELVPLVRLASRLSYLTTFDIQYQNNNELKHGTQITRDSPFFKINRWKNHFAYLFISLLSLVVLSVTQANIVAEYLFILAVGICITSISSFSGNSPFVLVRKGSAQFVMVCNLMSLSLSLIALFALKEHAMILLLSSALYLSSYYLICRVALRKSY